MSKKYIDADEFRKGNLIALDNAMRRAEKCGELKEAVYLYEKAVKSVLQNIKYAPAADVRPNVRGEWEMTLNEDYRCTSCGLITSSHKANFCPNCGSDNRGGGE